MKKNSQIHLWIETELKEQLTKEAQENNITTSDLIRKKLSSGSQLDRIERMLEELVKNCNKS